MRRSLFLICAVWIASFCDAQDVFEAARNGDIQRLQFLVKLKPDTVNSRNAAGFTPLIIAGYRNQMEVVKFLIAGKADVNADSPEGTALLAACYKGNLTFAELLISNGAKINAVNLHGTTALMYAAMSGNAELVRLLLKQGAKKDSTEKSGKTAVDYAKANGSEEVIHLLTQ